MPFGRHGDGRLKGAGITNVDRDATAGFECADTEIFFEHGRLGKPLAWSVGLHVRPVGLMILFVILPGGEANCGSGRRRGGDRRIVGQQHSLPASQVPTQNVVANRVEGPVEVTAHREGGRT